MAITTFAMGSTATALVIKGKEIMSEQKEKPSHDGRSEYEFVHEIDFLDLWADDDIDLKTFELFKKLYAERDAFREIAKRNDCHSDFDCCAKDHDKAVENEARCLLTNGVIELDK